MWWYFKNGSGFRSVGHVGWLVNTAQRSGGQPDRCPAADEKLRRRLRVFARNHPRLGWRKAHDVVRREGWTVNHKRLRRLWREEGLRRPPPTKNKVRRPGCYDGVLLRAEAPGCGLGLPV